MKTLADGTCIVDFKYNYHVDYKNAECVIIKEGTVLIPDYAFYYCDYLKAVIIPDGVKIIGKHAFDGCKNLSSLFLPNTIEHCGDLAFRGCENSEYVILSKNLKSLSETLFCECNKLNLFAVSAEKSKYISYKDSER